MNDGSYRSVHAVKEMMDEVNKTKDKKKGFGTRMLVISLIFKMVLDIKKS